MTNKPTKREKRPGGMEADVYNGEDRCITEFDAPASTWNIRGGNGNPISMKDWARCSKRGNHVLVAGDKEAHFCGVHARLALEGFVAANGTSVSALDRRAYKNPFNRFPMTPPHVGVWKKKES